MVAIVDYDTRTYVLPFILVYEAWSNYMYRCNFPFDDIALNVFFLVVFCFHQNFGFVIFNSSDPVEQILINRVSIKKQNPEKKKYEQ